VRSADREAPPCAISSSPLLPRIYSEPNVFQTHCSLMPSAYVHPSMWEANFRTHIQQQAKLYEISGFRCEVDENCVLLGYYHYSMRLNPYDRSSQQAKL